MNISRTGSLTQRRWNATPWKGTGGYPPRALETQGYPFAASAREGVQGRLAHNAGRQARNAHQRWVATLTTAGPAKLTIAGPTTLTKPRLTAHERLCKKRVFQKYAVQMELTSIPLIAQLLRDACYLMRTDAFSRRIQPGSTESV